MHEAFANRKAETSKSRSILSPTLRDVESLTPQAVDEACDQLSTFLFAGPRHDRYSVLLDVLRAISDAKGSPGSAERA